MNYQMIFLIVLFNNLFQTANLCVFKISDPSCDCQRLGSLLKQNYAIKCISWSDPRPDGSTEFFEITSNDSNSTIGSLTISNRQINSFTKFTIQTTTKIGELILSNDSISSLSSSSFDNLVGLKKLTIANNFLTWFDFSSIVARPSLTVLNLPSNQIAALNFSTIEKDKLRMSNLEELDLSDNMLTSTTECNLTNLGFWFPKLAELDLSQNSLTRIQKSTFANLCQIEFLYLKNNQIESIEAGSFSDMSNSLLEIYLDNNKLISVDSFVFDGLSQLDTISLKSNNLESLGAHSFRSLASMTSLELNHHRLRSIDAQSISLCDQLSQVDFSNNKLTESSLLVLRHMPALESLRLNFNLIRKLTFEYFELLVNLNKLDLSDNLLVEIDPHTFASLQNLAWLNLANNLLHILDGRTFIGLHSLEKLYLNANSLQELNSQVFKYLKNLNELDLASNKLMSIATGTLVSLSKLTILKIASNSIDSIEPDAFVNLTCLDQLILTSNHLSRIELHMFKGMPALSLLHLDQNRIHTIEHDLDTNANCRTAFSNLPNLEYLYLSSNALVELRPRCLFDTTPNLRTLSLSDNQLFAIDDNMFVKLQVLISLDLSFNRLVAIKRQTFAGLKLLNSLSLSNNKYLRAVENGSFDGLSKLTSLEISNWVSRTMMINPAEFLSRRLLSNLEFIDFRSTWFKADSSTFGWVDDGMLNKWTLMLSNISRLSLIDMRVNEMSSLGVLDLSHNQIDWPAFCDGGNRFLFGTKNVEFYRLFLSATSLSNLSCLGFRFLRKLISIDLSDNLIESIELNDLRTDCEPPSCKFLLAYLNLNNNKIKKIRPGAFGWFGKIGILSVNNNPFFDNHQLANIDLKKFESVRIFTSINCSLSHIPLFPNTVRVFYLYVMHNRIESLSSLEIRGLNNLICLDMSYNRLTRINVDIYSSSRENLDQLFDKSCLIEFLNLSHNAIDDSNLARINFNECSKLTQLNLSSNQIGLLHARLFHGLNLLETVDLSGNFRLRTIESYAFSNLPSLKTIFLGADILEQDHQDQLIVMRENFVSECHQLKFMYLQSFQSVWLNRDKLANALEPLPTKKKVNYAIYYNSFHIIVPFLFRSPSNLFKNDDTIRCGMVIWMAKRKIQTNLFRDIDFDLFLSSCFYIEFSKIVDIEF